MIKSILSLFFRPAGQYDDGECRDDHFDDNIREVIGVIRRRSSRWNAKRDSFIALHPTCAVCGNRKNLNVHHIKPFHLFPALELDDANLIVLCEGPVVNCHFLFGHMRDWRSYNPNVVELAAAWRLAISTARTGTPVVMTAGTTIDGPPRGIDGV